MSRSRAPGPPGSGPHASAPDGAFWMPNVDDPPPTEIGVILLGLDAGHLLAGLAVAALSDDPAAITLLVDQARHDGAARLELGQLMSAGAARWRAARGALLAAAGGGTQTASLRLAWANTCAAVARGDVGSLGPASAVYLTACLLRHADVDRHCETLP